VPYVKIFCFNLSGKVLGKEFFMAGTSILFDIYSGQDIMYVTLSKSCVSWPYFLGGTTDSIAIIFNYLDKIPNRYYNALYVGLTNALPVASRTDPGACQPVSHFCKYVPDRT